MGVKEGERWSRGGINISLLIFYFCRVGECGETKFYCPLLMLLMLRYCYGFCSGSGTNAGGCAMRMAHSIVMGAFRGW